MRRIQSLTLVGGYKLREPWARGSFAVDWRTLTLRMTGGTGEPYYDSSVLTYSLAGAPPMESFPTLNPVRREWRWWPNKKSDGITGQYANGLWFDGGRWWAAPRAHYDMNPSGDMTIYADDGTAWTLPLPQQQFSGFVKTKPGPDLVGWPYMGCGGYESGQGTVSGPTLADYDGTVHLTYGDFNRENPGPNLEHWNTRAPRLPDYFPEGHWDSWVGWQPRQVADVLAGCWASDWLYGGGVILPNGPLCYFPYQGTGELRYDWNPPHFDQRTITFAEGEWANRSSLLAYDPATFEVLEFDRLLDFRGPVGGQEVDPQGRLWLAERYGHGDAEVQIRVYEVTYA